MPAPKDKDYYRILGVKRDASQEEIRTAYRNLAREKHPDVNQAPGAAEEFARIGEAYEVLSDEEKRAEYNQFGAAGPPRGGPGAGGRARPGWPGAGAGPAAGGFDAEDLNSVIEEMFGPHGATSGGFGSGPFGGGRGKERTGKSRGRDLTITFLTSVYGGTENVRIQMGSIEQTIEVKIPPGIEPGAKLRIKGRGGEAPPGGRPGDLILTIDVGGHPYLRREGLDLLVNVPITIAEAALGTTVEVPLLKGTASMKVPPGASSGQKLRIKGKGIKAGDRQGDLFAVIQIVAPKSLSPRARELVEELGAELQNPRDSAPWVDDSSRSTGSKA